MVRVHVFQYTHVLKHMYISPFVIIPCKTVVFIVLLSGAFIATVELTR